MSFDLLVDHNMGGHAVRLLRAFVSEGWLDLIPIRMVTFAELGLPINSSDRMVWRLAQDRQLLILTGNRGMKAPDSLEQTLREENSLGSLPVITVSDVDRLRERSYREACATSLADILLYLDNWRGVGRIFIP